MNSPVLKKVRGRYIELQVAIWGENDNEAILCVHGLAANCRSWDTVCAGLAPRHRLIAMDLRGRGLSDRPETDYSVDTHAEDICGLLDSLGIERIHLMGHSFGAYVSMVFAVKYPERAKRLVLIDGGGQLSPEQIENIMPIVQLPLQRLERVYASEDAYLEEIKSKGFLKPWTPAIEAMYRHDLEPAEGGVTPGTKIACIQEDIRNAQQFPLAELYPRITQPVLVLRSPLGVFGDKDIVLPDDVVEAMMRDLPNARWADIPQTNHFSIVLAPNQGRDRAISDFLTDADAGGT